MSGQKVWVRDRKTGEVVEHPVEFVEAWRQGFDFVSPDEVPAGAKGKKSSVRAVSGVSGSETSVEGDA